MDKKIIITVLLFSVFGCKGLSQINKIHGYLEDYSEFENGVQFKWHFGLIADNGDSDFVFESIRKNNTVSFIANPKWTKFVQQSEYINIGGTLYQKVSKQKVSFKNPFTTKAGVDYGAYNDDWFDCTNNKDNISIKLWAFGEWIQFGSHIKHAHISNKNIVDSLTIDYVETKK